MEEQDIKMPKESAVDYMIRVVKEWVGNGAYKSGDKLPSEGELCRLTNISRGSVREAMKILSALGIVDIRQGSGTYITDQYVQPLIEPLLMNLKKSSWSINDLMDFREMIEKSVVELIVRNAADEDIQQLAAANAAMMQEIEGKNDIRALYELDLAFHRLMGRCTRNALFEILYNFTVDFIASDIDRMYQESESMGYISYLVHQRMVEALRRRDLATAKDTVVDAMKNHKKIGSALDHFPPEK